MLKNRYRQSYGVHLVIIAILVAPILLISTALAQDSACVACHRDFTPELIEAFQIDVHEGGVSCYGCHGGNPDVAPDAMEDAHEDMAVPPWSKATEIERCGMCHDQSVMELGEGPHGAVVNDDPGEDVPGCTSCHGIHPIPKIQHIKSPVRKMAVPQTCGECHANSDMMERHNLPDDIPNKYRSSVHGRALLDRQNLNAPSCIGCHDNHGSHHENVASFDEACSRCHTHEAQAFATSKHQRVWEMTNAPVCITCHSSHAIESPTVEMLGTQEGTICAMCHSPGEPPDKFHDLLSQLENEYVRGQAILVQAQQANKNVSEELKTLEKVRKQLEQARESVHYFDLSRLQTEVEKGLELAEQISPTVEELVEESSCITCHMDLNPEIVEAFDNDVHADKEISCHGCHGGNPLLQDMDSMDPSEGFTGVPTRPADVGPFCATCHSDAEYMNTFRPGISTDQLSQFKSSGHGRSLARNPNDENVATCTDCHGVHTIRSADDALSKVYDSNVPQTCNSCHGNRELMRSYGIFVNAYEDYRTSVHGQALLEDGDMSAPACNDCHGNHGALPPGINDIANVCGQCHARNASLFKESIHHGIWELRDMPQCESCHGNHAIYPPTDDMLTTKEGSFCATCHEPGSGPDQVRRMIEEVEHKAGEAKNKLQRAESYLVDVDEGYVKLDEARSELTKMRVLVHRFDVDTVAVAEAKALSLIEDVVAIGNDAIENAKYRRRGFLLALAVFALFFVALVLKIREMNKQRRREEEAVTVNKKPDSRE